MTPHDTDDGLHTLRGMLCAPLAGTMPPGMPELRDATDPVFRACWHVERMLLALDRGEPMPPPLSPAATREECMAFLRRIQFGTRPETGEYAYGGLVGSAARERAVLAVILVSLPPGAYDRIRAIPGALEGMLAVPGALVGSAGLWVSGHRRPWVVAHSPANLTA